MDELQKARVELLIRLKELFAEWLKASEKTGGRLSFSIDLLIEDILVACRLNDDQSRAFVYGKEGE